MPKLSVVLAGVSIALGAVACVASSSTPPEPSGDASTPIADAAPDTTVADAETPDTSVADAPVDAGTDCAAVLARMLAAPVQPPRGWFGLDLSNGGAADGGAGGGGLTIDEADILACATTVEPTTLAAGQFPVTQGSRTATFGVGSAGGLPLLVSYNIDSRIISFVLSAAPATGTLAFHSREGGGYVESDGGTRSYVIGFGPNGDGGMGYVTRDGVDFPAEWGLLDGGGGVQEATPWANELYDGMMATYAPSASYVPDCLAAPYLAGPLATPGPSCLFRENSSYFGPRPLGFFIQFNPGTNQAVAMYEFWPGGAPSCATPNAAVDQLDYFPITQQPQWNPLDPGVGPTWWGVQIGGISASEPISNAGGLLATQADTLEGCNGVTVTAPDPGYGAEQWGPSGELELEYNVDSGVAYKLSAKAGYKAALGEGNSITAYEEDGGMNTYVIAPGTLTMNGAPLALDWAQGDAGTLNSVITDISNTWWGFNEIDCVQDLDCAIVPDDHQGHSTFTILNGPFLQDFGLAYPPLTIVFAQGTSVPTEIYTTNAGGQIALPSQQ